MNGLIARKMLGLAALVLAFGLVLALGACGKKGDLEAPPGSTYPHQYPSPSY
jgi:predicted small lipoprotein YifL